MFSCCHELKYYCYNKPDMWQKKMENGFHYKVNGKYLLYTKCDPKWMTLCNITVCIVNEIICSNSVFFMFCKVMTSNNKFYKIENPFLYIFNIIPNLRKVFICFCFVLSFSYWVRADSSYFFLTCVEHKGIFIRCLSKYYWSQK